MFVIGDIWMLKYMIVIINKYKFNEVWMLRLGFMFVLEMYVVIGLYCLLGL